MKSAYLIIETAAAQQTDVPRLVGAFDLVWARIADRVGERKEVRNELAERVARLIVATGNRRPDVNAEALATIVGRTFDTPADQDPLAESHKARPRNPS